METPFFGGFSTGLSPNLSDGACVNLYPEVVETKDGKRIGGLYSTPGLKKWASVGAGPIRGLHNAWGQSKLITVSGNTVYSIDVNGAQTTLGTLATIAGPVSILSNTDQVFVCDGVAGMVYSGGVWSNTGLVRPGVAISQDTFGLANSVGTNQIFQSNAGDLSIWDPLSYTTADSTPSPVIGMAELFRQVWAFKSDVGEIYNDVGSNGFAFARMQGAYLQIGCIAPYSVAAGEHQILWLGQNDKGTACVYTTNGYQAVPCSYHALDYALAQYSVISDAMGFVYQQGGHEFYVLSFPTAGATWVYDTRLKLWHRRGEYINGAYELHDGQCHAQWLGMNLVGSSSQGVIYQYSLGYSTDDIANPGTNNPKRWMRRWRALQKPVSVPMRFPALQIDMQTGDSLVSGGPVGVVLILTGHLPAQIIGSAADFRYAVKSTLTMASISVTAGALPAGLSMDSMGHITGTPTETGTYSWSVTATNIRGDTFTLPDSCTVSLQLSDMFALMSQRSSTSIWFGTTPEAFPYSASLQNGLIPTGGFFMGMAFDGSDAIYAGGASNNSLCSITNQDFLNSGTLTDSISAAAFTSPVVVAINSILFQFVYGGPSYAYSTNHGSTWTTVNCPAGLYIYDIVRLDNGTWCANFSYGSTQTIQYSKQSIPTGWTVGLGGVSGTLSGPIACDGTTVVATDVSGNTYTSTDGIHWNKDANSAPGDPSSNQGFFICAGALGQFAAVVATGGALAAYYSADSGATWTKSASSFSGSAISRISYGNGYFLLNTQTILYYSADGGTTWLPSTLPSGASGNLVSGYL